MAKHEALIQWHRYAEPTTEQVAGIKPNEHLNYSHHLRYSRSHTWIFDNGLVVEASGAPESKGDPSRLDPEELFVTAVSSCHMLSFLWVVAQAGYMPLSYEDRAVEYLKKNAAGKMAITEVRVFPKLTYSVEKMSSRAEEEQLHHCAHEECFIANSVNSSIGISLDAE